MTIREAAIHFLLNLSSQSTSTQLCSSTLGFVCSLSAAPLLSSSLRHFKLLPVVCSVMEEEGEGLLRGRERGGDRVTAANKRQHTLQGKPREIKESVVFHLQVLLMGDKALGECSSITNLYLKLNDNDVK